MKESPYHPVHPDQNNERLNDEDEERRNSEISLAKYASMSESDKDNMDNEGQSEEYPVAIALFDNEQPEDEDELAFVKGDELLVLEQISSDWLFCKQKLSDASGQVPMNYIAIT
jgi:hypothetical protein